MKVASILVLSGVLTACSASPPANNTMNVDENLTTTDMGATTSDMNAASAESVPIPKVHNYQDRDGNTYEYVSAVSEDDRKKGKAVGNVSSFAYRGVVDGVYRISAVDNDGRTQYYYECSNPCAVIKSYQGGQLTDRVPYDPGSIIGAAFEDAFNGFLKVAKEPRPLQPLAYPAPTTPYYPSPPTSPATAAPQTSDADSNGF